MARKYRHLDWRLFIYQLKWFTSTWLPKVCNPTWLLHVYSSCQESSGQESSEQQHITVLIFHRTEVTTETLWCWNGHISRSKECLSVCWLLYWLWGIHVQNVMFWLELSVGNISENSRQSSLALSISLSYRIHWVQCKQLILQKSWDTRN